MSDAQKALRFTFMLMYVLLIIPALNWFFGPVLAACVGLQLLITRRWARLLGLLCGAIVWGTLSFYLLIFTTNVYVALGVMLTFFAWTWFLLKLMNHWDHQDASGSVALAGRIES